MENTRIGVNSQADWLLKKGAQVTGAIYKAYAETYVLVKQRRVYPQTVFRVV